MKVAFANDHAGTAMRQELLEELKAEGVEVLDFGNPGTERSDYPDHAQRACEAVVSGKADRAVLVCGTGIGISIAANKIHGIRCALCHDAFDAEMSRRHNDANALALRGREMDPAVNRQLIKIWLSTPFDGGERHQRRIEKIHGLETPHDGCH